MPRAAFALILTSILSVIGLAVPAFGDTILITNSTPDLIVPAENIVTFIGLDSSSDLFIGPPADDPLTGWWRNDFALTNAFDNPSPNSSAMSYGSLGTPNAEILGQFSLIPATFSAASQLAFVGSVEGFGNVFSMDNSSASFTIAPNLGSGALETIAQTDQGKGKRRTLDHLNDLIQHTAEPSSSIIVILGGGMLGVGALQRRWRPTHKPSNSRKFAMRFVEYFGNTDV